MLRVRCSATAGGGSSGGAARSTAGEGAPPDYERAIVPVKVNELPPVQVLLTGSLLLVGDMLQELHRRQLWKPFYEA
jgi:hypothetical protein